MSLSIQQLKEFAMVKFGLSCFFCGVTTEEGCFKLEDLISNPDKVLIPMVEDKWIDSTVNFHNVLELTPKYVASIKKKSCDPENVERDGWIVGKHRLCCKDCLQEALSRGAKLVKEEKK